MVLSAVILIFSALTKFIPRSGCSAKEYLHRVQKTKNAKKKWKRKQCAFNKPLSTEEDGKQLFLILSDDRIRGNCSQVYHKGPRLPIDGRKNFLPVTVLNNAMGDQQELKISLESLNIRLNSSGYNAILA